MKTHAQNTIDRTVFTSRSMKIVPIWHTCILRMHVWDFNCIYLMSMPPIKIDCIETILWRNQSYIVLLIYSLEEGRYHLFQTILSKYTNPFWLNDCSSILNSQYKCHRFKTSCGHHDEPKLKSCLMRARHLYSYMYIRIHKNNIQFVLYV